MSNAHGEKASGSSSGYSLLAGGQGGAAGNTGGRLRKRLAWAGLASLCVVAWMVWSSWSDPYSIDEARVKSDLFAWSAQCPPPTEGRDAIACHIHRAQDHFNYILLRQSRTVDEARRKYVSTYLADPPPGFDGWAKFALKHRTPIVDDYGQLLADIAPSRRYSPKVLRQRIADAHKQKRPGLHLLEVKQGKVTIEGDQGKPQIRNMLQLLEPVAQFVPDFKVLLNLDDRHRVCGPDKHKEAQWGGEAPIRTAGRDGAWDALRKACPHNIQTLGQVAEDRPTLNLCQQSSADVVDMHGMFRQPVGCFNVSMPILSAAKLSTFEDVATVPWCYADARHRLLKDNDGKGGDVARFDQKQPAVYWRGAAVGLEMTKELWWQGHRQRAVLMAHQFRAKAERLAEEGSAGLANNATVHEIPGTPDELTDGQMRALAALPPSTFDVSFDDLGPFCARAPEACESLRSAVPVAEERAKTEDWLHNRFVLDLDGNGISCDFYKLLDSNSLVFKQTVWVEHHDDRLVPWLHYVPLSLEMTELPQLLDFFINDEEGVDLGAKIAAQGASWARTALRPIDLSVFLYRQFLELAWAIRHD